MSSAKSSRLTPEQMNQYESIAFHPSVKACRQRKCTHLVKKEQSGVNRNVCDIGDRIPGNLLECPLEEEKGEASVGGIMHNSISSYNTRREITVTAFNDGIATADRYDRGEYQEIISSIVKAARLNGYQIPQEETA